MRACFHSGHAMQFTASPFAGTCQMLTAALPLLGHAKCFTASFFCWDMPPPFPCWDMPKLRFLTDSCFRVVASLTVSFGDAARDSYFSLAVLFDFLQLLCLSFSFLLQHSFSRCTTRQKEFVSLRPAFRLAFLAGCCK